jgi:hypothetical protein
MDLSLLLVLAMSTSAPACSNSTLESAARAVADSLSKKDFTCVRSMILNPKLKFSGDSLDPAVHESLAFRASGKRSYFDIVGDGVVLDYAGSGEVRSVFFVRKADFSEFSRDKQKFKAAYFMSQYFVCNFRKVGSVWRLTEDFCFTEGEY